MGGLATLTKGQPLYIAYGSQITLRHTYDKNPGSRPCWLHSHAHVYPVRYKDGRGSSHQQQVTCYTFKDVNNWWIVKNPDKEEMVLDDPVQPVKHGDIVQLVHGLTSRALNSHDVAAPLTPQCQEVSCYINYNVSMPPQNLWKVQIINRANDNSKWETIKSHVRLVHVQTNQALKTTGLSLPEWGFNQLEVATDRHMQQDATIWNVEEHRYNKNEDKEGRLRDIQQAELIPMEPTYVSFWEKFWELQTKMLFGAPPADIEHKYRSNPLDWPFVSKNVAYWMHATTNAQIHLLGNTVVWVTGTLSVLSLCALLAFYLLRRRRGFHELNTDEWKDFLFLIDFIVVGYFLHYLPYFLTDRTLFLHHYLPCMLFKVLAVAAILDHIEMLCRSYVTSHSSMVTRYVVVALVAMATWVFIQLSCVTYGNVSLTAADVKRLSWRESWDFLLHQIGS
ncbi:hypothetical protein DPMN_154545 [Dreissena polymorpha]|uniref:dolichyl-phosphate-mannose--protein mannosyltransferase n=1 Tax=Dreissena polymorpha TaxID=45954 RepID=A0A9D4JAH2_DREPO|nr:hypothetical protein DPMN_154545 [Dreissena polymorpha]